MNVRGITARSEREPALHLQEHFLLYGSPVLGEFM